MKNLLVINFFPAFNPPTSGGELRFLNLYRALSNFANITLLSSTDFNARQEEIHHTSHLKEIRFPKDHLWADAYATLDKSGVSGDLSGLAFAMAVSNPDCNIRKTAVDLSSNCDAVIHEFPFSEPIFWDTPHLCEIYNSHNFELGLLGSIIAGVGTPKCFEKLRLLEKNLTDRAKLVIATSESDAKKFQMFYGVPVHKLRVCPNGFNEEEFKNYSPRILDNENPKLLFTGSAHRPNVDAARFLADLAVDFPDCEITIAGSVAKSIDKASFSKNLKLIPYFDMEQKSKLFSEADIFVNPIVEGSGTNLKTVEALAAGIPLITTPEGARGISIIHEKNAYIADRSGFSNLIRQILREPSEAQSVGSAGRAFAVEYLSWSRVALNLWQDIFEAINSPLLVSESSEGGLLLVLNNFSVADALFGGARRIREICSALNENIIYICFGETFDIKLISDNILQVTIAYSETHSLFLKELEAVSWQVSANDVAAALFAPFNLNLVNIVSEVAPRARAVIFEHCYMATTLDTIKNSNNEITVVYSAHNVEQVAKKSIFSQYPLSDSMVQFVSDIENSLVKSSNLVVTCTSEDAKYFSKLNDATLVVPNGCVLPFASDLELARTIRTSRKSKIIVGFLGSAHPPNIEAANYIINVLAPEFPEVQFEFLGGLCSQIDANVRDNVFLHGILSDRDKTAALLAWDIALNPVAIGGGSSVKVPDYLAHEIAVLCTPEGARGFDIEYHDAGKVAERTNTIEILRNLCEDLDGRTRVASNGFAYANRSLTWLAATGPYREFLQNLTLVNKKLRPNLLVVTYRYTEPPLGGAEEYLVEILSRMRSQFERIDLAASNVQSLTNDMHFSCNYTQSAKTERIIGQLFDQVRLFDVDYLPRQSTFDICRRLERAWANEDFVVLKPFFLRLAELGQPILLSGFFGAENHNGIWRRWTAATFAFSTPARTQVVTLKGWTPGAHQLGVTIYRITGNGLVPFGKGTLFCSGGFEAALQISPGNSDDPMLIVCSTSENVGTNDHRPLALLLDAVTAFVPSKLAMVRPAVEPHASLLEGFYAPERYRQVQRWTAESFTIKFGADTTSVVVSGWSQYAKELRILRASGEAIGPSVVLNGYFSAKIERSETEHGLARLAVDPHTVSEDTRVLGVLLTKMEALVGDVVETVSLEDEFVSANEIVAISADMTFDPQFYIRTRFLEEWMSGLKTIALSRSDDLSRSFAKVRGPHSQNMQNWLASFANNYDAILVQGIPFDTIPRSVETIRSAGYSGNLVLLPHFHGDDRFYYWDDYLRAFSKASSVLLFSTSVASALSSIGAVKVVPGGGIREDEVISARAFDQTRAEIGLDGPFFLVLGRKAPSKGYRQAIEAVKALRRSGSDVSLLMIGPDEDGAKITDDGIFYIGRQPRDVVVGALSECVAVVTMSQSESFGIVICEGWNARRPVIANRACYSFRELVTSGETGLLVETTDELAEAMQLLATDFRLADRMGEAGFRIAASQYTWGRVANAITEVLLK